MADGEGRQTARRIWFGRFWQIENWDLKTRKIDYYRPIVQDTEAYAAHMALMRRFFSNPIDMFPGDTGTEELTRPARFYKIEEHEIAERFPGDQGEVGDEDVRKLLSYFADLFQNNIIWLVALKKSILVVAVALLLLVFFNPVYLAPQVCLASRMGGQLCPGGLVDTLETGVIGCVAIGIVLAAFFAANSSLANDYQNILERSAQKVNGLMAYRTNALTELFSELIHQIDQRKTDLNDAKRKEWPEEAGRWMVVAYWVSQRLEYIERFVQIQMWRVRRGHYFVNRAGLYLTRALAVLSAVVLVGLVWVNHEALQALPPVKLALLALAASAIAVMNYASYAWRAWRTPLLLVKQSLGADKWRRYSDLDMQQRLYKAIQAAKQDFIDAEEKRAK